MSFSLNPSLVSALGWALIHSLWQCAALAMLAWIAFRVLRSKGPQARYLLGCGLLALMLIIPLVTFLLFWTPVSLGPESGLEGTEVALVLVRAAALPSDHALRPVLPWLITAWMAGVSVMSLRLAGGWCWIQRLRWVGTEPAEALWQARLEALAGQMNLLRPVRLRSSRVVEVPMVLGWLKPLILVPAALFAAMEPCALAAILAHELAHVRRHDYFLNLLQSVVEVLLFFHPAVWWLSAQIRAERENCCDDIAASICGDPLLYARALAALEDLRQPLESNPSLALAATGGTLMNRIRRLITPKLPPSPAARAGLIAALTVSVLGAASTLGLRNQESPKAPEAKKETREEKKTLTVVVEDDAKAARKLKIQMKGKVKIQPEAQPPVALEEGARLEIEGRDGEQLRSYSAERGPAGEKRIWTLEGKEQAPDAQAEAWLKKSLEATQKFSFRWDEKRLQGLGKGFHWMAADPKAEKELEAKAKALEEKAKALAEKRVAKGASEKEIAGLQEEVAKQAKEVAAQARKIAGAHARNIDPEEIKVVVARAKAEAEHVRQLGEEHRKELRKHITVTRSDKEGEPMTIQMDDEVPVTVDMDIRTELDGKHVIIKQRDHKAHEGEVMILHDSAANPKAEIEALQKAIQKLQGRLEKLQKEAEKAPKAPPTK